MRSATSLAMTAFHFISDALRASAPFTLFKLFKGFLCHCKSRNARGNPVFFCSTALLRCCSLLMFIRVSVNDENMTLST
jgi:hypothetical protein